MTRLGEIWRKWRCQEYVVFGKDVDFARTQAEEWLAENLKAGDNVRLYVRDNKLVMALPSGRLLYVDLHEGSPLRWESEEAP